MSKELTANGKVRVGVAYAPAPTPLFIVKDADGTPHGVTIDLGEALAKKLGVAVEFFIAPNTGLLTDARAEELDACHRLLELLERRAAVLELLSEALDPRRWFAASSAA